MEQGGDDELAVSPELARLLGVQWCCTSTGRREKKDSLVSVISGFGIGKHTKNKEQRLSREEEVHRQHNAQPSINSRVLSTPKSRGKKRLYH